MKKLDDVGGFNIPALNPAESGCRSWATSNIITLILPRRPLASKIPISDVLNLTTALRRQKGKRSSDTMPNADFSSYGYKNCGISLQSALARRSDPDKISPSS